MGSRILGGILELQQHFEARLFLCTLVTIANRLFRRSTTTLPLKLEIFLWNRSQNAFANLLNIFCLFLKRETSAFLKRNRRRKLLFRFQLPRKTHLPAARTRTSAFLPSSLPPSISSTHLE